MIIFISCQDKRYLSVNYYYYFCFKKKQQYMSVHAVNRLIVSEPLKRKNRLHAPLLQTIPFSEYMSLYKF